MSTMQSENLVTENMGLVYYLANRFYHPQVDREDIASIGSIGLIKASRSFKESEGKKFSTFAAVCIKNEIMMAFKKERGKTSSLDDPVGTESENLTLLDLVPSNASVDDDIDRIFAIQELHKAIEKLSTRDKFVVQAYYGIGCEAMTQAEVAKYLGCTQSYVQRILREILAKFRKEMGVKI